MLGHSEGGIIAPAVAAADKSVAFVVMIAGPCIRGDKLFVLQSAMTAKAYGAPDDYIADARFRQNCTTQLFRHRRNRPRSIAPKHSWLRGGR